VDVLAGRWRISLAGEKFHAWFGDGRVGDVPAVLMKPTTYMNRSGQAVLAAGRFYKAELSDLLVICDDLALPVGRLRMRASGSAGSHNGLQNIIDRLGSEAWCRLRIGIGSAVGIPSEYVTSSFDSKEEEIMTRARHRAADAVESWLRDGPELTMTRFNGDPPGEGAGDERETPRGGCDAGDAGH